MLNCCKDVREGSVCYPAICPVDMGQDMPLVSDELGSIYHHYLKFRF